MDDVILDVFILLAKKTKKNSRHKFEKEKKRKNKSPIHLFFVFLNDSNILLWKKKLRTPHDAGEWASIYTHDMQRIFPFPLPESDKERGGGIPESTRIAFIEIQNWSQSIGPV